MNPGVRERLAGRLRRVALTAVLGTATLLSAPAVSAAMTFGWSGADTSSPDWSLADNWSADGVPTPPIGLSFRDLGAACDSGGSSAACYASQDDMGAISVFQLAIDDSLPYVLAPEDPSTDTITIDASSSCGGLAFCGLEAAGEAGGGQVPPDIGIPIVLGNSQTWYIDGGYFEPGGVYQDLGLEVDDVSGSSRALLLDFADGGTLYSTTLDTGAVTARAGGGVGTGYLVLEQLTDPGGPPVDAELPSAGLTLQDGMTLAIDSPDTSSGPISVQSGSSNGSLVLIGQGSAPDATLAVDGHVSLDPATETVFDIDDNGSTPGTDFSQLTATDQIDFDGSSIVVDQGQDVSVGCADLATGDAVVLASASGGLSGDIEYTDVKGDVATLAPGQVSAPIPIESCAQGNTAAVATLAYGLDTITATIVGTSPTRGAQAPTIGGTPAIGNTLTATSPGSWRGTAPITHNYQWLRCFDKICSPISGATGETYQLTNRDYNSELEVQVTSSNAFGSASADSNALGPVTNAGAAGARPIVSGVPRVGNTLTTTPGSWVGSPNLTYHWQSCTSSAVDTCSAVIGAGTTSYMPGESDLGKYLLVTVCPGSLNDGGCEVSPMVGPVLVAFPSPSELRAALSGLGHPTGRRAAASALMSGSFSTEFSAPSAGALSVVWTTRVITGEGRRRRTRTVMVATGTAHPGNVGTLRLRLYLTSSGKALLRKKIAGLPTTATERFEPTGGNWTSLTKKFSL